MRCCWIYRDASFGASENHINTFLVHLDSSCFFVGSPIKKRTSHCCEHRIFVSLNKNLLIVHACESICWSLISEYIAECIIGKFMDWIKRKLNWWWQPNASILLIIKVRDVREWEYKRSCKFFSIRIQTDPLRCCLIKVTIVKELIPNYFRYYFWGVNDCCVCTNKIVVSDCTVLQDESHKLVERRLKVLLIIDINQGSLIL